MTIHTEAVKELKQKVEDTLRKSRLNFEKCLSCKPDDYCSLDRVLHDIHIKRKERLEGYLSSVKRELEFLEKNYTNFTWDGRQKAIQPLLNRIADIKEAIKLGEKE